MSPHLAPAPHSDVQTLTCEIFWEYFFLLHVLERRGTSLPHFLILKKNNNKVWKSLNKESPGREHSKQDNAEEGYKYIRIRAPQLYEESLERKDYIVLTTTFFKHLDL